MNTDNISAVDVNRACLSDFILQVSTWVGTNISIFVQKSENIAIVVVAVAKGQEWK